MIKKPEHIHMRAYPKTIKMIRMIQEKVKTKTHLHLSQADIVETAIYNLYQKSTSDILVEVELFKEYVDAPTQL